MSTTKEKIEKNLGRKFTNQEITRLNNIGRKLIKERGKGADGETIEELEALVVHRFFIIARKEDSIKKRKEGKKVLEEGRKRAASKKPSIQAAKTLFLRSLKTKDDYYTELNNKYVAVGSGPEGTDWMDPANYLTLTKAEQKKAKTVYDRYWENYDLYTELSKEQGKDEETAWATYQQIKMSMENI
jgi:hypothetical protein